MTWFESIRRTIGGWTTCTWTTTSRCRSTLILEWSFHRDQPTTCNWKMKRPISSEILPHLSMPFSTTRRSSIGERHCELWRRPQHNVIKLPLLHCCCCRQLLPQDRALSREKGQPFCMAQYQRLFASYRAPGLDRDHLRTSPPSDDNEHIIVAHQGQVTIKSDSNSIDFALTKFHRKVLAAAWLIIIFCLF